MAEPTEDTSGYSPLLAQMMKIDPEKIGSVSLSALGRQAMGAESESYKAAKAEVDSARELMKQALQDRKGRVDPTYLALAQGFLAPTRTGSFGESLGTAAGAFGKAFLDETYRFKQEKGRPANYEELRKIGDRLIIDGEVLSGSMFLPDPNKKFYEATPEERKRFAPEITSNDRKLIRTALESEGIKNPTEAQVLERFKLAKGIK